MRKTCFLVGKVFSGKSFGGTGFMLVCCVGSAMLVGVVVATYRGYFKPFICVVVVIFESSL